ncbi:MAG: FAD-dependent oxidoreductase [Thermodesulfobacterium sp.]|nr:FAD-dependent oxidoreductase [Thermodesulfobacterium sp.]
MRNRLNYEVVIIGGGPSGLSAAIKLAERGVKTLVIERGRFCGSKNVFGGVIYTSSIKNLVSDFPQVEPFPCERPITEEGFFLISEKGLSKITFLKKEDTPQSFSALRAKFDSWLSRVALEKGVDFALKTKVIDLIKNFRGEIKGVVVERPESWESSNPAQISAKLVIIAEGVNRVLTQKAGLLKRDWSSEEVVLSVKEVIQIPKNKLEARLGIGESEGLAVELVGDITLGLPGTGFLYTNQSSLSFGIGVFLKSLVENKIKPYELLEKAKAHPYFRELFQEGEILEYSAHLIPEWGLEGFPNLYGKGVLAVGDAVGLVNPIFREGANLAIYSGIYAAETAYEALKRDDFSEKTLSMYEEKIKSSYFYKDFLLLKDLKKTLFTSNQWFTFYPQFLNFLLESYVSSRGREKREVLREILQELKRKRGKLGILRDIIKILKLFW